jgi:poly-gamma-glutamate synthesis protein (capsule biosynthesis protein)
MLGRGVDRIQRHRVDPRLYEAYASSAEVYVEIAERANGPIPRRVDPGYVWGDALAELEARRPHARIVNLETAVTSGGEPWPGKGIHYRTHPANVACLSAAGVDACVLANNHVLDWGRAGLADTLAALRAAGLLVAGAGEDEAAAGAPAIVEARDGRRVMVFACATADSGVPGEWGARERRAGVELLPGLGPDEADAIVARVRSKARPGDLVVVSIHWGGNWRPRIAEDERAFAHRLVDSGAVHVVHGHSSHHPRAIEVRRGRPILYGCGDLVNDYEGISGHEAYRPNLALLYLPEFDAATGRLARFLMVPMRRRRLRLERAGEDDRRWLAAMLTREGRALGTRAEPAADGTLALAWEAGR